MSGCGCKKKDNIQGKTPIMVQAHNEVEIIELEEPPYSIEEVIRVREYFNTRIKNDDQREFVIEWNRKFFEPQQQGYCDQVCFERIRIRAEHAFNKCIEYEKYKMNGK
jgi:hypothetical protein